MLLELQRVNEVIESFIARYVTLDAYRHQVAEDSSNGYGPAPVPGFHVSCRIEGGLFPYLLEWPTTDYQLSLDQAYTWAARIGDELPGRGCITSVDWTVGSWIFDLVGNTLSDIELDKSIRDYLKKGWFPYIHCNNQGRVWLPNI